VTNYVTSADGTRLPSTDSFKAPVVEVKSLEGVVLSTINSTCRRKSGERNAAAAEASDEFRATGRFRTTTSFERRPR